MHTLIRRAVIAATTTSLAAIAAMSLTAGSALADSTPGLQDPWVSTCNDDKMAIDQQLLTKDAQGVGYDDAGTVTLFYSPSCQTNWIELDTPYGIDYPGNRVSLFIGTTESPWTNDRSAYENGDGPLTREFRSMMIPAPGSTCVHYYGGVQTFTPEGMVTIGGTNLDKTVC